MESMKLHLLNFSLVVEEQDVEYQIYFQNGRSVVYQNENLIGELTKEIPGISIQQLRFLRKQAFQILQKVGQNYIEVAA